MDTETLAVNSTSTPADFLPFPARPSPADAEKRTELTLDALKRGIVTSGEHRLFRSGKLEGLFPSRAGASSESALQALSDGLIETVRTETKGKQIIEWVRVTPKGVAYVHDRDSPRAVLRELRDLIGNTRDGIPDWMEAARQEMAAASEKFERRASEILKRLDSLTERVDAAIRRSELAGLRIPDPIARVVPWGVDALGYLDRRIEAGATADCTLGDLFRALRGFFPDLTVPEFHAGLRRLHDIRAVRLTAPADGPLSDPEYAMIVGSEMCTLVGR